jgi:transposase
MMLIGCDFHPSWQQISWFDEATGEIGEQKLVHAAGDAEKFYRQLPAPARIGMESTGNCQWFVEMVTAAGHHVLPVVRGDGDSGRTPRVASGSWRW